MNGFIQLLASLYYLNFRIKNNFKIVGAKNNLPPRNRPRFILVGNHSSGADAYLMMAGMTGLYMRRIYAVAHEKSFKKDTIEKLFLEAFEMIPRVGTGQEIIYKMGKYLMEKNRIIAIVPEAMLMNKVSKGFTGVMRLYWLVNSQPNLPYPIPILPVASIGANQAYPISVGPDGKYHPKKTGIIARVGKPIYYELPKHPSKQWYREKTDELMDHIAHLALQKEGAIDSWKLDSVKRNQPREYH